MNIKKVENPIVYPLGIYERYMIKDSSKHIKSMNTSSQIKKMREYQSSITTLPGNIHEAKNDQAELLEYNMKTKNIELKGKN